MIQDVRLAEVTALGRKTFYFTGTLIFICQLLVGCKTEQKASPLQIEIVSEEVQEIEEEAVALNQQAQTLGNTEILLKEANDIKKLLKIVMSVPSYVDQPVYSIINNKIGEISFSYQNIEYSYRGSTSCEEAKLDQIAESFTDSYYNIDFNGVDFEIYTTVNGNRLVSWTMDGVNHSLYAMGKVENTLLESLLVDIVFGEDVFGDASYVANQMLSFFHGINGYLYFTGNTYTSEDDVGFWICLTYVLQSMKDDFGKRYQIVNDEIKIKSSVINKLVASLYPERGDITDYFIPEAATAYVRYSIKEDCYYFKMGEVGAVSSVVTFAKENSDGLLYVESTLLDDETNTTIASYHYTLQLNTKDDGFSLYPYTMGTVLPVQNIEVSEENN